jgi:hypothetical protein
VAEADDGEPTREPVWALIRPLRRWLARLRRGGSPDVATSTIQALSDLIDLTHELGIREIRIDAEPTRQAFELVLEGFGEIHRRGLNVPRRLTFLDLTDPQTVASYFDTDDRLAVNVSAEFWTGPDERMRRLATSGYFVTADPRAIVYHEVGHALHRRQFRRGRQWWNAASALLDEQQRAIAERVSAYAVIDAGEFVAETFAGLIAGMTFDDEVMALYRTLKGPLP